MKSWKWSWPLCQSYFGRMYQWGPENEERSLTKLAPRYILVLRLGNGTHTQRPIIWKKAIKIKRDKIYALCMYTHTVIRRIGWRISGNIKSKWGKNFNNKYPLKPNCELIFEWMLRSLEMERVRSSVQKSCNVIEQNCSTELVKGRAFWISSAI